MFERIRNFALIALVCGAFYFLLTHHVLFNGLTQFDLLKKTEPTLENTFISVRQLNPRKMLRNDNLYNAGLGDYLLEKGLISAERLQRILDQIDQEIEAREETEN